MNKMGINTIVNNCLFNLKEQYHDSDGDIVGYKIPYLTPRDSQEIRDAVAEELVRRVILPRMYRLCLATPAQRLSVHVTARSCMRLL